MKKNYNIDDIENFLNKEMDADSLSAFEREVAADSALADEVNLHNDVLKGIKNAAPLEFRKMVAGVHQEMKAEGFFSEKNDSIETTEIAKPTAKIRRISFGRSLALAASFALVLLAGWWLLSQPTSPEQLFAANFAVHQDMLSNEIEDRLAETGFGTNKDALNQLQTAITIYNSGDYERAIDQFNIFQNAAPNDALATYAQFYKGISLLKTGKVGDAQKALIPLANSTHFSLQNDAKWYAALAYLKQGKTDAAKAFLQDLAIVENYQKKATAVLENL